MRWLSCFKCPTYPTMDASSMRPPPPQEKMRAINNRYIPAEMVEEILLNLPVKSLLRFSSVSKLWNSTILESGFVKRYSSRAALSGGKRIALMRSGHVILEKGSSCLVSSISSNNSTVDSTEFNRPFGSKYDDQYTVVASCDDLWLARSGNGESLFLWNPSMRTYKKVPNPSSCSCIHKEVDFIFGLGYECVGDDYKILKISIIFRTTTREFRAELYSLRSDSWRNIKDFPTNIGANYGDCALVSGKLHLNPASYSYAPPPAITCFDLLTDKFGEVALRLPNYSLESRNIIMHVSVLRGMLCVSINYLKEYCEIWVMEEYGVAESWTKKFTIQYAYFNNPVSICTQIMPLYLYDNGEILIRYINGRRRKVEMFVYNEDEKSIQEVKISSSCGNNKIACRFVYVDSLVALN